MTFFCHFYQWSQKMLESLFICFQVEQEYIAYVHDGSETLTDNFTVVANQTETRKHSPPCTVHINVTPVNDETPVVTTNRGLKVRFEPQKAFTGT